MLFMVIEHFKPDNRAAVGERFQRQGRMLPEGVVYHSSWMETNGARCYQVMEATRELLDVWIARWSDLVDFEIVPVKTSAEYWKG
jgi:hypothetical protein